MGQRSYTQEYRTDAVKLAQQVGTAEAAKQLKIPTDTLYTWVARAKSGDLPVSEVAPEPKKVLNLAEKMKELEKEVKMLKSENSALKRENQILEEATAFFAARRKKSGNV